MNQDTLSHVDPEIAAVIDQERQRQTQTLEMIASENIASHAVMAAQGSVLTNKYAEGYPANRYYGGCEFVDMAESLAIERAREVFNAPYVNVQPHSGSQANMAVYFALLTPGDTIMGMGLAHGGHLTHGSPVNFSGKLFNFAHYGVNAETGMLDYEAIGQLAKTHRPRMIVAGASAYPRIIDFKTLAEIAASVDALLMVDMAHIAGLVAAGVHPSPVPHAQVVTSTTHKTLRGPRGGLILAHSEFGPAIDKQIFPGIQGGPLMHVIAAKAVAFQEALAPAFKAYQKQVVLNAKALADALLDAGLDLVSGGTDNHLMLVDLRRQKRTGADLEAALGRAGITVNKNAVPFDPLGPKVTSGIRVGTPSLTSRGMGETEMVRIAGLIAAILHRMNDAAVIEDARRQVETLCANFPLHPEGR